MDRRALLLICLLAAEQGVPNTEANQGRTNGETGSAMFFYQDQMYPRDCKEVQDQCSTRNATGAHLIRPDGYHEPFWVSCSDEWTVFQRRLGHLDFRRSWKEFRNGFGYLNAEHWLGNEKLSQLTNQKDYELRIEFETDDGQRVYVSYEGFRINDEFSGYSLVNLGQLGGTAESSFTRFRSKARDCYDVKRSGNGTSGNYVISPSGWDGELTVNCNMTIDGGGWTVIQRRIQSSSRQSFNKDWPTYRTGFGDPSEEFWIGNEKLFLLTRQKDYEMRIDMVQYGTGRQFYAKYNHFRIDGESDKYRIINLGNYTGNTEYDALRYHHGLYFSTPETDNDFHSSNCAGDRYGGWWYHSCYYCDLNRGDYSNYIGYWYNLPGSDYLIYSEMKIRPT